MVLITTLKSKSDSGVIYPKDEENKDRFVVSYSSINSIDFLSKILYLTAFDPMSTIAIIYQSEKGARILNCS